MSYNYREICDAFDKLPREAIMQGCKASIASDVSRILGIPVSYWEIENSLKIRSKKDIDDIRAQGECNESRR